MDGLKIKIWQQMKRWPSCVSHVLIKIGGSVIIKNIITKIIFHGI